MDNKKETKIGKDVIEALTLGMYEDSKFVYREYIQNSADQIDKAVKTGILNSISEGEIYIAIDNRSRSITITDNATGIKTDAVEDILKNIAQSTKVRGTDKGFRGIGRLGGLGYCDELSFTTSFKGENIKTIMTWNASELKNIINNRSTRESASQVIDMVTSIENEPEKEEAHYFEVKLKGVTNETLLNIKNIKEYLGIVAPVNFHPRFIFKEKIVDALKHEKIFLDEYKIWVNTDEIFKEYTTSIYQKYGNGKTKIDEIIDLQFFKLKNKKDELMIWGWYGLSTFDGVIPSINHARGIRLRKGNIQIGNEHTLDKLHQDAKSNRYFFGEVHAIHHDLIPNARRDYFLENELCLEFEDKISEFFDRELKPLFNVASKIRSADRKILKLREKKKEIEDLNKTGVTNGVQKETLKRELEEIKLQAEHGKCTLENIKAKIESENRDPLKKIFKEIVTHDHINIENTASRAEHDIKNIKCRAQKYSKLSRKERKLITQIFEIIDSVLPKDISLNLKQKIDEKFK